jgi:hypothetical protein
VACGGELDRDHPVWEALAPEREAQRRFSYRISQLLMPAIDLAQVVSAWQLAIRDPAQMNVFCTDRLALPKSAAQTLTPAVLEEARGDYRLLTELRNTDGINEISGGEKASGADASRNSSVSLEAGTRLILRQAQDDGSARTGSVRDDGSASTGPARNDGGLFSMRFGGLDLGDQCWFVAREVDPKAPHVARLLWIEPIAAERVRARVPELFRELGLSALCVDAGPLRDLARDLAFILNGLDEEAMPSSVDPARNIFFRRGAETVGGAEAPLQWHAASERWLNVRCAPVEFTQREGQGLRHKVARTQDGRIYPLLAAHRDESIQRVVNELRAEDSSPVEKADGTAAKPAGPRFLLPQATEESRAVLNLYERHLLAGARQERSADGRSLRYLDRCENHFLLATAYAALAELLAPARAEIPVATLPVFRPLSSSRSWARRDRSLAG